jgi:hypothetical protein
VKIHDSQIPMFFENEPPPAEVPYLGTAVSRKETATRAGTVLDHRWTTPIEGYGRKGKLQHGLYDQKQRIFQTGGEFSRFVYWKERLVSFSYDAWRVVIDKTDWFEVIDHERNECWRIAGEKARNNAVVYEAGLGKRVGIPMDLWDVITARNTIRQEGK